MPLSRGNILATKNRIAHIRWRIQIIKTLSTISPIQNCLSQAFQERVGIIAEARKALKYKAFADFDAIKIAF